MQFNPNAVKMAFRQQYLQFIADPQWIIPSIISPFMFTIVVLMLYPNVTGPVVLTAVLGGGVLGMWGNTLFASSFSIMYDRTNGTLETIIGSPTNIIDVIIGRSLWNAFIGLLNALLVFVVAELIFQTGFALADPLPFFLMLVLTLLSLAAIGLIFSAAFVFSRRSYVLNTIAEYPLYILSGALVPITELPQWTNWISYCLAPTWGVEAMRITAIEGYQSPLGFGLWECVGIMVVLTIIYILIAKLLLGRIEHNILETGSATRY